MTTEVTLTPEQALQALQEQSADRLVLFRLHQACTQDIVNYINQRTAQLSRDLAEVAEAQKIRAQRQSQAVITPPKEESASKSESEDADSDSE